MAEPEDADVSSTELEVVRPYIELARAIQAEVARVVEDDDADADALVEAIEFIPRQERARVVRAVFDLLPADRQWSIIESAFDDDELRRYLADEHVVRLAQARRSERQRTIVTRARSDGSLDLRDVPPAEEVTVGLFRQSDVRAAVDRGHLSSVCARQIVLRATDHPGYLRVIDDVFNPRSGLFVTAGYDESVWQDERLPDHGTVRLGSIIESPTGQTLETVLYPTARLDVELDGDLRVGRLRLGFVLIGPEDVFAN